MSVAVLLLEANDSARTSSADALRAAGCDVLTATSSEDAFAVAAAHRLDVIVMSFDHDMRDDRYALCARLKADARTRRVPILLTSTSSMDHQDLERATGAGVLALVLDSPDSGKLVSAVQGVVAARHKPAPLRASLGPDPQDASKRSR